MYRATIFSAERIIRKAINNLLFPVNAITGDIMSVWNSNTQKPAFKALDKTIRTDVLIIGGGIAGILCAYELQARGIGCIIAESGSIFSGTTHNTTAKITAQHSLIYRKLIKKFGKEKAKLYLNANLEAVEKYKSMSRYIDCDFEIKDSFVYTINNKEIIEDEIKALNELDYSAGRVSSLPLPFETAGAVCFREQAQFNPLKFLYAAAENLDIYENTRVKEYHSDVITAGNGEIIADKIIVATHFPIFNKHGLYPLKMHQNRSYVIALENAQDVDGMYIDEDKNGLSLRNYGDLLLLGGGSHRTGKNGGKWDVLREAKEKYYPNATEIDAWAAQDCMTLDSVPYIGLYSKKTDNCFVTTGFNKWGMTSAMASALILADLIQGKENKYAKVFTPSRSIFAPQLAVNAFESTVGLLTPGGKRCPHLGCKLKWNNDEHTWDCSCHGSRFNENGKLIENPSNHNLFN